MSRAISILLVATLALVGCASDRTGSPLCNAYGPRAAHDAVGHAEGYPLSADGDVPAVTIDWRGTSAHPPRTAPAHPSDEADLAPETVEIVLPSIIHFLVGQTYRLNYADVIAGLNWREHTVEATPVGSVSVAGQYWEYTPETPASQTLTITVKNRSGAVVGSASRPVVAVAAPRGANLRHLGVGDSITRAGGYVELAVTCILRGATLGSRTYDEGGVSTEGRGGWTLHKYATRVAQHSGGDSPFLFPKGIDGAKFLGNTAFWKDVAYDDPRGYDYDGFQMAARDWKTEGPYSFGVDGYPTSPDVGDVVVDPTRTPRNQWQEFTGTQWSAMDPQPVVELSFSKYIDRYASAFSTGTPTSVSVMLGTVDFLTSFTDSSWTAYKANMDALVAAIRAWDSDVPIILIGPPNGAPPEMWAGQEVDGTEFDRRILEFTQRLYAAYDSQVERERNLFVVSFLGTVQGENMADYVHPKMPEGHEQMAPWLAGILAWLAVKGSS